MAAASNYGEILDARADGYREGVNASRYDFDRGRKLGRGEGFKCGFLVGVIIAVAVATLFMFI